MVGAAACSGTETDTTSGDANGPNVTFATTPPAAATSGPPTTDSAGTAPDIAPADTTDTPPVTDPVAALPDPQIALQPVAAVGSPVDLAVRPGDDRLFVARQDGTVVIVDSAVVDPSADVTATALDVTDLTEGQGEQGLLGLAFHPSQPLAYVNYTDNAGDTVIAEFAVGDDGVFDPASRRQVMLIEQPYANHNGGGIAFGPDGFLYIGMGDGGAADDPERVSLNVTSLLGKMLRIDPVAAEDAPYTVPPDNPFVGTAGARPEIWSVGVRNPWRFSFDSVTGDLWIADVGQNVLEEVSVGWAVDGRDGGKGVSFGWSAFEGSNRFNDDQPADGATPPIHDYEHGSAGCSISGGQVYRGTAIAELAGWYVYADYCSGSITALEIVGQATARVVDLGTIDSASAVRVGPDGELYVLSLSAGVVRIVQAG
jgi:glucose/arabinose dehydrogenase